MERQISEPSATYQDILDLPETLVGEIINGRLVFSRSSTKTQNSGDYNTINCCINKASLSSSGEHHACRYP